MGIHWQELILILLVVLILFGPKRLPEIGSSLGSGIRSFKESMNGTTPNKAVAAEIEQPSAAAPVAVPVPVEVVDTTASTTSTTDAV